MTAALVIVRVLVVGLHVCAVLLPLSLAASSPYLAQSARSFARILVATPFQSIPLLHPVPKNQMLLALAVLI